MKKIIELFADPVWVFSSFFFAIFINFVSAIAKDRYDEFSGRLSEVSKNRKADRDASVDRMAAALKGRVEERVHLHLMQLKAIARGSVFGLVGACLMGVWTTAVTQKSWLLASALFGGGAYFLWSAFKDLRTYNFLEDVFVRSMRGSTFWKEANQTPERPATAATSPAAQEPRKP